MRLPVVSSTGIPKHFISHASCQKSLEPAVEGHRCLSMMGVSGDAADVMTREASLPALLLTIVTGTSGRL